MHKRERGRDEYNADFLYEIEKFSIYEAGNKRQEEHADRVRAPLHTKKNGQMLFFFSLLFVD